MPGEPQGSDDVEELGNSYSKIAFASTEKFDLFLTDTAPQSESPDLRLGPGIFTASATGAAAFYFLAPPLFSVTSSVAVAAYWLSCTILVWLGAQQKQRQSILQRLVDERTAELQGLMETFKRGAYHDPLTDLRHALSHAAKQLSHWRSASRSALNP